MSGLQPAFHWHSTTVGTDNHFQLTFNRFRAAHACNAHLSWMNNASPPTERSTLVAPHAKTSIYVTTKASRFIYFFIYYNFILTGLSLPCTFDCTNLIFLNAHPKLKSVESLCCGGMFIKKYIPCSCVAWKVLPLLLALSTFVVMNNSREDYWLLDFTGRYWILKTEILTFPRNSNPVSGGKCFLDLELM